MNSRRSSIILKWVKEIPKIIWGYYCTPQPFTKNTLFQLTYASYALIPVELGETSWRRQNFDESSNNDNLRVELDPIHKIREEERIKEEVINNKATCCYHTCHTCHRKSFSQW